MLPPEDLSAELPPPRDDEPASLRRDILDELADHLQCGLRRELLTNPANPSAARRRVLDRFGNPAAVARQLWLDALKEDLMSQRLTAAALVVLTLLCVGLFVFTWQSQAANRDLIEQQQATTAQLFEKLADLANRPTPAPATATSAPLAQPSEWNRLRVHCQFDRPTGVPPDENAFYGGSAPGVSVQLSSASDNTSGIPPITMLSDEHGLVDFGQVLYGQYRLEVSLGDLQFKEIISVRPGQDVEHAVVCPRPENQTTVRIRMAPAEPLPSAFTETLWVSYQLKRLEVEGVWCPKPDVDELQGYIHIIVRPDGLALLRTQKSKAELMKFEELANPRPNNSSTAANLLRFASGRITYSPDAPWADRLEIPPGQYVLERRYLYVTDPTDSTGRSVLHSWVIPGLDASNRLVRPTASPAPNQRFEANPFTSGEWTLPFWTNGEDWALLQIMQRLPEGAEVIRVEAMINAVEVREAWDKLMPDPRIDFIIQDSRDGVVEESELLTNVDVLHVDEPSTGRGDLSILRLQLVILASEKAALEKAMQEKRVLLRPRKADSSLPRGTLNEEITRTLDLSRRSSPNRRPLSVILPEEM